MQSMTIGRHAVAAGVHVETIRYYQIAELLRLAEKPSCRGARAAPRRTTLRGRA